MTQPEVDVAIVGAGLAGLAAARTVRAAGRESLVLEARERVGGRVVNVDVDGELLDMGGQWIGPTQERIAAMARELGVETFPTRTEGANLVLVDGRLRRDDGDEPHLDPAVIADMKGAIARLDEVAATVDVEAPWRSPGALDATSFAAWVTEHMRTPIARRMMRLAGRGLWGAELEELSLLHVAFYVQSAGNFSMLSATEGGAQQDRFAGGAQSVALRAADELGERVLLGAPVTRIAQDEQGVTLATAGGVTVRAARAIVAVPPALTAAIEFEPQLPPARRQLAHRMTPGWLVKVAALYDEPFWREHGLSGKVLSADGLISMAFDNTPRAGAPAALVGFAGGANARAFARLDAAARRGTTLDAFASFFGERARTASGYVEQDWGAERWSCGGPNGAFATGGWSASGEALRTPVGRIAWAGTEVAARWHGYMEGAVRSGEDAAAATVGSL